MQESRIKDFIYKIIFKLPVISQIKNKQIELTQYQAKLQSQQIELQRQQVELETNNSKLIALNEAFQKNRYNSIDSYPWNHPYLTANNISRFRIYSESVWQFALDYLEKHPEPIKCAFLDNMAQNMHKWAMLVQKYNYEVALFPNIADVSAIGAPEWENFDGEFPDLLDGTNFLNAYPDIPLEIPCYRIPLEGSQFYSAYLKFCEGDRSPLLHLLKDSLCLRYEPFMAYQGVYPYYQLANALSQFDVIYGTNIPIAAYLSGKPYCVSSTGGDLQFSTGMGNDFGQVMNLAFNAARFLMISNPHTLGHCRRLGLTNGVYLPYPMDDSRYFPGEGKARKEWEAKYGKGVYVLTTSRLDKEVKGQDETFFQALINVAQQKPEIRFIFLAWGNSATEFRQKLPSSGIENQFIILSPVGKKRLIDYYRSCDIVLDQFVYGYYGATALEAAAIGKPVIMKLRTEQYEPLYLGDVAPMVNVATPAEIAQALLVLVDNPELREHKGKELRQWLVRNHGEEKTIPLMQALLRLTADQVALPQDLINPLWDDISVDENAYHGACQQPISN
ncbi:glycosyltransferase [Nostoc sp. LEGE 06077]|uniref:glycosyltransferase n=1 Tax=Nostoc sp. LEGE 06077 TaxID=915325 RepID=UPI001880121F|nr:glycosyltransferase [Nostoc sp. LEGE 06077]